MQKMGFRGITLNWFGSYLRDRPINVCVNGVRSGINTLNIGVPQGSVIAPLLFLLYINDMSTVCNNLKLLIMFADDTTAYLSGPDLTDLCRMVTAELALIDRWLMAYRLSLNI